MAKACSTLRSKYSQYQRDFLGRTGSQRSGAPVGFLACMTQSSPLLQSAGRGHLVVLPNDGPGGAPPAVDTADQDASTVRGQHRLPQSVEEELASHNELVLELIGPEWGLHLYDVNIALGNLVNTVAIQTQAYGFES